VTQLILVRHGETEANVGRVWHGSADAPLTKRGRMQVAATARHFAGLQERCPVDAFYVSPLQRARSTAAAIAEAIGMEPRVDPELREFSIGDWEGRSFDDLREQEDLWGRWERDPGFSPPNGESPLSFGRRAVQVLERLVVAHPGETVLVVSHGGLIGAVLARWFGEGREDWARWDPHNCAVSVLRWDGARWHGELLNDISHLPLDVVVREDPVAGAPGDGASPT
jgi:broad specificity phosphatase PhoE